MPFMDRDSFIGLLNSLGDPDDATALAAAREVNRRMTDAGLAWDELLVRPGEPAAVGVAGPVDLEDEAYTVPAGSEEDAALIDRLLAGYDLSTDTRQELLDLKGDIGAGEFTPADGKYVRDLAARLGRRKAG